MHRAWRVQFSSAIGPYNGGMRFHPSVNRLHSLIPRLRR
ncbi:Glu/Leu/Phe/Val dehydrogenase dimerization domain-containing protein [Escherichia coli]